jgi:hypothetical protein
MLLGSENVGTDEMCMALAKDNAASHSAFAG